MGSNRGAGLERVSIWRRAPEESIRDWLGRQCESECRTFAEFTFQPYLSSMKLNKFLRQCQPQPGSFFFVSIITAHLAKLLEDRRLFSWWNTDTGLSAS
jgi:hypothetical protein